MGIAPWSTSWSGHRQFVGGGSVLGNRGQNQAGSLEVDARCPEHLPPRKPKLVSVGSLAHLALRTTKLPILQLRKPALREVKPLV